MNRTKRGRLFLAALGVALSFVATIEAATISVTNSDDSGPGSLREAIYLAVTGDVIQFAPSLSGQPIILTTGELFIDKDLSVVGLGEGLTIIDGNHASRVLRIGELVTVAIASMTIRNGFPQEIVSGQYDDGVVAEGGGIYNAGSLTLDDISVQENFLDQRVCTDGYCQWMNAISIKGGGIYNRGMLHMNYGSLRANEVHSEGSTIMGVGLYNSSQAYVVGTNVSANVGIGNKWSGPQGAIFNDSLGLLVMSEAQLSGNMGESSPAMVNRGQLNMAHCSITGNGGWVGGGMGNSGVANVIDSSIISNWSGIGGDCAGISNVGSLTLKHSTVAYNRGENAAGVLGGSRIINSTITGNEGYWLTGGVSGVGTLIASSVVGNISGHEFAGVVHGGSIKGTLLAGNYNFNDPGMTDCGGPITSLGHNILGEMSGCSGITDDVNGDRVGVDWGTLVENGGAPYGRPIITLADNGGPTPTVALLPDSPAIDTISPASCTDEHGNLITTDQRGVSRPQGIACDNGAFEFGQPRAAGFWSHQCSNKGYKQIPADELQALLAKVAESSSVFPECAPIDCDSLNPALPKYDLRDRAKLGLLDLWLNLLTGKQTRGRPIDLPALTSARTVGDALSQLELTVCAPLATRGDLGNAIDLTNSLNNGVDDLELASTQSMVSVRPGTTTTITLGLVNMSSGSRNYSVTATGPWGVQLSTTQVNGLISGDVATLTATITAPGDQRTPLAFMQFVATDTVSPGNLTRDLTIAFRLDTNGPTSGRPVVKPVRIE